MVYETGLFVGPSERAVQRAEALLDLGNVFTVLCESREGQVVESIGKDEFRFELVQRSVDVLQVGQEVALGFAKD